jgi:hypothetical protein
MKSRVLALVGTLLVSLAAARADTVTLNNGSQLTGEILSQTPDDISIEYFVTPTIKDQKTISRDSILKIVTIPPDEKAFAALSDRKSPSTLLDTSFHDLLLDKKIPEFLQQFTYSRHVAELRKDVDVLDGERSRLRRGDRKIDGVWLTAEQIQTDPYQSGALLKFAEMKQQVLENDTVGSLKSYELLESSFPGSSVLPDAIDLALDQLSQLQDRLTLAKANYEVLDKRRQKAIDAFPPDQASEIKGVMDRQSKEAKSSMNAATADGSKFFPVFQNNRDLLEALQLLVTAEQARLTQLQKTPMREGIAASKKCTGFAADGQFKQAREQLDLSLKLWPANIENTRLKHQIDELEKAQNRSTLTSQSLPTPSPKIPPSSPTPEHPKP